MTSDNERREVARRLREGAGTAPYMNTSDDFAREVFRAAMNESVGDYRAAVDRLADLIEPSARCPHYMHPCCRTDAGGDYIDRDALLELAYTLQAMGEQSDEKGRYDLGITFTSIADRIREALGVQDA